MDIGMKKQICEEAFRTRTILKIIRKGGDHYSIGYVKSVSNEGIILLNDRTKSKAFLGYDSMKEIHEMPKEERR